MSYTRHDKSREGGVLHPQMNKFNLSSGIALYFRVSTSRCSSYSGDAPSDFPPSAIVESLLYISGLPYFKTYHFNL